MAYFDPRKQIAVQTEASFVKDNGLFQRTGEGLQPVHYISPSMTSPEKKYSQSEKDASCEMDKNKIWDILTKRAQVQDCYIIYSIDPYVQQSMFIPRYEIYREYIVFAFSVIVFVCLSVCLFVCL